LTYQYPILACADIAEDFSVRYEADLGVVQTRVANANRIALFVHGIIGDTREMAASLKRAGVADRYDLILTFDYENLEDPIAETARTLKSRLANAGLSADHTKSLDIIAHSMGGLVCRWFIEREGGARVVRRLVMLGTPNGGTPWPNIVDWATTAVAYGLNQLSKVVWPAAVLGSLTQAVSSAEVTLRQMMPGSDLLDSLARSTVAEIPYFIIGGNTSLLTTATDQEHRSKLQRLLRRLWRDQTKYELANLVFAGVDNDIAVPLTSMKHLPERAAPPWDVWTVGCDHMTYFNNPDGLKVLSQVLS
jgi:pimeloyl-ACP methyl ester carboxylesterase